MTTPAPNLMWVTRTSPDCHSTAGELRKMGHRALALPILHVEPVDAPPTLGRPDAIVFTSVNGVRHHAFDGGWAETPVFAVGDRTAEAASAEGYRRVRSASGDVGDLKSLIVASIEPGARVLLFGAAMPAGDLDGDLGRAGYRTERRAVYRTHPAAAHELGRAIASLPLIDAVLIHSPRAGEALEDILSRQGWSGTALCLSDACAAAVRRCAGVRVRVAERPDEAAMLRLVRQCWPARHGGALARTRLGATANDNGGVRIGAARSLRRKPNLDGDDPPPSAA